MGFLRDSRPRSLHQGHSMSDFRSVQLKTIITIDGKDYVIETCDYSESVAEAINDSACGNSSDEIIEFVLQN